jgi:hypothetical protein
MRKVMNVEQLNRAFIQPHPASLRSAVPLHGVDEGQNAYFSLKCWL